MKLFVWGTKMKKYILAGLLLATANFSYSEGFKTGLITGFVATIVFTAFFLVYATEINGGFLPELLQKINIPAFESKGSVYEVTRTADKVLSQLRLQALRRIRLSLDCEAIYYPFGLEETRHREIIW